MEILEFLLLSIEMGLVSLSMKIMSIFITVVIYGRMIGLYLVCSVALIPFATMTNREWGQVGNNYLKSLFALGFQDSLILVCVRIYAVLVKGLPQQALACEGTSKIYIAGTAGNRDFYGKVTPFLCLLFHLFLNLYNNGKRGFANFHIIMYFWFLS